MITHNNTHTKASEDWFLFSFWLVNSLNTRQSNVVALPHVPWFAARKAISLNSPLIKHRFTHIPNALYYHALYCNELQCTTMKCIVLSRIFSLYYHEFPEQYYFTFIIYFLHTWFSPHFVPSFTIPNPRKSLW